jgi:hypothetical protein
VGLSSHESMDWIVSSWKEWGRLRPGPTADVYRDGDCEDYFSKQIEGDWRLAIGCWPEEESGIRQTEEDCE